MIRTFWQNLSKIQKIGVIVFLQILVIIIIAAVLNGSLREKNHVEVRDDSGQTIRFSSEQKREYEDALWDVISNTVDGADKSVVQDAVVREGSYKEEVIEANDSVQASFLVDIDSIQMTYKVVVGWFDNGSKMTTPIIDCPMPSESKYPNSVCQGTYRSVFDLSMFLPYTIESQYEDGAPDVYIDGDEENKTINVMVSVCDPEANKKKAMDYLNTTSINLSEYDIEYEINSIDVNCGE